MGAIPVQKIGGRKNREGSRLLAGVGSDPFAACVGCNT